jgi:integrase
VDKAPRVMRGASPCGMTGCFRYHWLPTLRRLGLSKRRQYDCRHSVATLLLEAGQPMKVVQEALGHASMPLTADTYSHVSPAFKRQAADSMESYLSGR